MSEPLTKAASVVKVDEKLRLVFGFAIVCKQGGSDYYDVQNDHIPEEAMLKAADEFMCNSRVSGEMHERADGDVVFAFPLTTEIAKALGIETERTGLLVAIRPSNAVFEKFQKGEYTGFSIGGERGQDEVAKKATEDDVGEVEDDDEESDDEDDMELEEDEEDDEPIAKTFDESKHPRDDDGKFGGGAGGLANAASAATGGEGGGGSKGPSAAQRSDYRQKMKEFGPGKWQDDHPGRPKSHADAMEREMGPPPKKKPRSGPSAADRADYRRKMKEFGPGKWMDDHPGQPKAHAAAMEREMGPPPKKPKAS